ncbi:plastocyanin/azurin family copper-binding protein [Halobacterium noricense]|uniref:plastocyanin/azurin family copper-binding protein n=1 Tax=Halobacterium noricense TaxID=223182 RepID=UPI001E5A58B9|nr:plastocyanin/azurin family copper-binding protein [Halobacterium noricense]UHH24949.1 plastocyanin/azurin family copper-binding protein [Halobacterium noricense]
MRRRKLLAAGASALAAALAGCTGGDDSGTATGTTDQTATTSEPTTAPDQSATTSEPSATPTENGNATVVTVAPDGNLEFAPESVTVAAGTTVRWEWDGSGHNVRPASQPADADWTGTEGGNGKTYGSGHRYAHAFEVPGQYDYYCAPHKSLGMRGSVVVE